AYIVLYRFSIKDNVRSEFMQYHINESCPSIRAQIRRPRRQRRKPLNARAVAQTFPTHWQRRGLWQTKQCSRGTDRKRCLRFALSLGCLPPWSSVPQLRACPAVRRASAQKDAGRHLDFQKASAQATRRKPCASLMGRDGHHSSQVSSCSLYEQQ